MSNPESIANEPHAIQIVDTLKSLQNTHTTRLGGGKSKFNRTAVMEGIDWRRPERTWTPQIAV
jgi:hypothetical protein